MTEPNHGLEFGQEVFITVKKDGELVAVELENGHIERFGTKRLGRVKWLEVLGLDKVQQQEKKAQ